MAELNRDDLTLTDEVNGGWTETESAVIPSSERKAQSFEEATSNLFNRLMTIIFGGLKVLRDAVDDTLWTDHFSVDAILLDVDDSVSPVEIAPSFGEANGHSGPRWTKSRKFTGVDDVNPIYLRERAKLADGELEIDIAIESVANQIQDIELLGSPTGGTWSLTFDGEQTTSLDHDASAQDVEDALRALPNLRDSEVTVTGSAGGPYEVTFLGQVANNDVPLMTFTNNLSGDGNEDISIVGSAASGDVVFEALYGPSQEGPWTTGGEKKISHDPVYAPDFHTLAWDFGDGVNTLNDLVYFKILRDKFDNDDTLDSERVVFAHGRTR